MILNPYPKCGREVGALPHIRDWGTHYNITSFDTHYNITSFGWIRTGAD